MTPPKKRLDQVRDGIRLKRYSRSTEKTYVHWIKRFILFHNKRHPLEMGECEIEAFLTDLAVHGKVAASTQNQAFHAILVLYRYMLNVASNIHYHAGIPAAIRLFSSQPHRGRTADRALSASPALPSRRHQSERNEDLIHTRT